MDPEAFETFFTKRYENQISWYDAKAARNKNFYYAFQWGVIILSAIVPVLVSSLPNEYKLITIIISTVLTIGTAALKLFKFQEKWVCFRTVAETLKKEKSFYDASLGDYAQQNIDKEAMFVDRVESMISREHSLWITTHLQKETEPKQPRQ